MAAVAVIANVVWYVTRCVRSTHTIVEPTTSSLIPEEAAGIDGA
jgi:hypothetical protein